MNGFKSNYILKNILKHSRGGIGLLAIAASLALPLTALAQNGPYTDSGFAGAESGDWGGKNGAAVGPPDGTCANMGAVGKINIVSDFGLDLESVATITGARFRAKAAAAAGQSVSIQVCTDVGNVPGSCVETLTPVPVNVGGSGNCANTSLTDYVDLDHTKLTEAIVENPTFGLAFEKIEKSEVKVDSLCLEVDYTTTFGGSVTSQACFEAPGTNLTLIKNVLDGAAAPADWDLLADSATTDLDGVSGVTGQVDPGVYALSESNGPAGYLAANPAITCGGEPFAGSFTPPASLTLVEGDNVTCTFFNQLLPEDTATLTLLKDVTNDNGGQASEDEWNLSADGPVDFIEGPSGVTGTDIGVGAYTLAESGPSGYTQTNLSCTGTFQTFDPDNDIVTLADGDVATCTFYNDDDVPPPPAPPSIAVPTLSQWALILLTMVLLGIGLYARREQGGRR